VRKPINQSNASTAASATQRVMLSPRMMRI
jgi:hypothetical protein